MFLIILAIMFILPAVSFAAPVLEMSSTVIPSTVVPGNEGYISLSITNIGTSADSIKIRSVSLDSSITAKTFYDTSGFGGLDAKKSLSTVFKFSAPQDTASGFYRASFKVQACSGSSCTDYSHEALIDVRSPSSLELESISPSELKIGEKKDLVFTLENSGTGKLNNIVLTWESESNYILPLGKGNRLIVSSMGKEERREISVPVVVSESAVPGISSIDVEISYDDPAGVKQTVSSTVGTAISGDIELISNIEENKLYFEREGTAAISIVNRGTISAEFLTAMVESEYGSQEFYIGEIEPDDYESIEINQDLAKFSSGSYPLKLGLKYKDTFNKEYTIEKEFTISPNKAVLEPPYAVIIIIVAAALTGIFWFRKRRKRHNA